MQEFPSAELKTATMPENQKLYLDAVKNFKKLHDPKIKFYQKIKSIFHWVIAIGALYILWNSNDPQRNIFLLFLLLFTLNEIKGLRIWLYVRKTRNLYGEKYLKTFGKITQVSKYDAKLKQLEIEFEFYGLENQSHKKKFNIAYPDFLSFQPLDIKSELLVGQSVEVCLTPDFALLLQIRAYHKNPDELPILTHHFHNHPLWQRHENYLLHPSYFYPESMLSIYFFRDEYTGDFQLVFKGLDQDFSVYSTSPNLEQIENYIFASYSDFFMKHDGLQPAYNKYRQLKFSNEPTHVELWKTPTTPISNQEIQAFINQNKRRALLWMISCLLIILLSSITVSVFASLSLSLLCLGIYSIYFEYASHQSKFYQRCVPQL
ncbi:hypothetical protein [Acinetobacter sp. ANC 5378]|uniref:hypothetical protein n=1 Tax=Acinetobacter sp. ANC 5378 TaxID=2731249 RepID=UPI0014901B3E|nr:hypothetical protein [Acinetobacter sp. ANC 5378]NNG80815.1 hypothetical protein [Acinetobacter sp. ANC 5378]